VSFDFAKIEVDYRPQKPDGTIGASVRFGFDLKQNKAF
jgi:type VI protein secretion system component Hcp